MRFSISNIAWRAENDRQMYEFLSRQEAYGVEIAPTRLFEDPYKKLDRAGMYAFTLRDMYGLEIPSMQSIWYGISQSIFATRQDRDFLLDYTKKAADFAAAMEIQNMVFGCPKNRNIPRGMDRKEAEKIAGEFFKAAGLYADKAGAAIAIEPNPPIYNTNFLNTTHQALEFVRQLSAPGVMVNIDMGTMIYNGEDPEILKDYMDLVNHIHISMPHLAPVEDRPEYHRLRQVLKETRYSRCVSVEMSDPGDIEKVKQAVLYVKNLFGDI